MGFMSYVSDSQCKSAVAVVVFAALLLFAVAAPSAHAQVLYGSVIGTVADASGGVIPAAQVALMNKGTGASLETQTGSDGVFRFTNVLAGSYELTVTAGGFRAFTQELLTVTVNTVQRIDVAMQVGQVTETITVEGAALTLQTEKTDVNANLSPKEVTDMPLPRYRNYQSLINLVPGATPARFQNANTDSPARAMTTNVNGTNRNNNNTRIDGSTSVFIWLPHHTAYVPPSETIETVNISTNNFDAEQGMAGGAAVTVTTKSGTNELHGSAFWLHENGATAAKDTFFSPTEKRPVSQIQIPGFTVGGPIVKDKLFFFGAYEGLIERVIATPFLTCRRWLCAMGISALRPIRSSIPFPATSPTSMARWSASVPLSPTTSFPPTASPVPAASSRALYRNPTCRASRTISSTAPVSAWTATTTTSRSTTTRAPNP
jgi:hypothetical protein